MRDCGTTTEQVCPEMIWWRARKGIVGFFGPDSTQYAQAGGTRASERKAPTRNGDKTVPLNKAA